jgi:hypothetical protein
MGGIRQTYILLLSVRKLSLDLKIGSPDENALTANEQAILIPLNSVSVAA